MSNKFEIVLSARDKFTAAFNKLEKTAGQTNRALGAGEKTTDRTAKNTDVWAKSMERVTRAAESSVSALRDASTPLEALGGLRFAGTAGAVVALAAGAVMLTQKWASQTTEMARTSKAFDLGTGEMQEWSAAAKAAGYDSDAMAASMSGLSRTLYMIRKNLPEGQRAAMLLRSHEIDTSGSTGDVMAQISGMLNGMPSGITRSRVGVELGLEENSIRFLAEGHTKINGLLVEQRRLGAAQSAGALGDAQAQVEATGRLEAAWRRVYNTVGAAMSPTMTRVLDALSDSQAPAGSGIGSLLSGDLTHGAGGAGAWPAWLTEALRGGGIAGTGMGGASAPSSGASAPSLGGIQYGSQAFTDQLSADLKGGAQFSSPETRDRMMGAPVQVEVSFVNAPPGTTATARSGNRTVPVRIAHSMQSP